MSQDIVRQSQRNNGAPTQQLMQQADDLWMQQQALAVAGPTGPGAPGGADVQPLQVVHRTLRGRYKLAVMLAAAGAIFGAALGYKLNEQTFRARGLVKINPQTQSPLETSGIAEYTRYMASEATTIRSSDIAERALSRPEWTDAKTTMAAADFLNRLNVTYVNNSFDILVTFDHPNKNVAAAAVKATLGAYSDYRNTFVAGKDEMSVKYFEDIKTRLTQEIAEVKRQILQLRRENERGDIAERSKGLGARLTELENRRADQQMLLDQMIALADKAKKNPQAIDEKLLAARDPFFARLLTERDTLAVELTRLSQVQGANSPLVRRQQDQLASLNKRITEIGEAMSKGVYGVVTRLDGKEGVVEVNDLVIESQKENLGLLDRQIAMLQKDVSSVENARFSIDELNDQVSQRTRQIDEADTKLQIARARALTVNAPYRTITDPNTSVAEDKRTTMATFGFVVGAGLPLLGLVLYGLFDRKFRYSDEATTSAGTRGIPLLGILPNLPDRLSDPSQASVAAHCVHQIRTMLQLNVLSDGPSVLTVTSATSGDGKTSLSLALGLSFAASGSRTLLIDTDLIGAGLSARLGIREPQGISEAVMARDPMEYVRETDVADLSVLPVGTQGTQNASAFSPSACRRLMDQVRKHYDIILVDTGPVLGSIEATPIVAAGDAVILTVARGQNRDLVEKAIAHLRTIGARIAGVVFNRANTRDFERSISGISLRSVSRAQANGQSANGQHQDKRLGPLVHSVRGTKDGMN